ncbi:LOW QUALITY PROTEIN: adenylate cyclase type 10-like, partial [Ceratina calcarata]|uniref:LOW QUALITY PROTEIN: adenylate cyclase type 10-like n=1 Tax=Ceratina calcarata TaxID=156304 RepID=A0AAJ7S2D3_9HYME
GPLNKGFTDLAEKYTKAGKGGPSKLTETLNSYIGAMVQEILFHNGDVLKFSGDAFIVMWKLHEGMMMRDLAVEAMNTACVIQKHFGTYDTDVGVTLRVKLAIASGKTYFTSIGDPESASYYIITGKPVWDVKYAEGVPVMNQRGNITKDRYFYSCFLRGGDILVAPSSWQWVNPHEYVHETLPDGIHTLIITCTSMWYQARDDLSISTDEEEEDVNMPEVLQEPVYISKTRLDHESQVAMLNLTGNNYQEDFKQVDYSLRPKIVEIAKARLKGALRSYMLRPVIRSVEMDEPLEYLTEMRQVVILFINVITTNIRKRTLISLVNSAYKLVCNIVGEMHGCVNKTSLFDKDLMFLCVFGLRGDKHELESQIGLRCATKLRSSLLAMENIKSVSVGVTTGMTYCGVVGHILRREYTVIGMSVNKAARLMVVYRDKVVCDRESFLHSHLEARHFILQEPRFLKGITNVGPIYEFHEQAKYTVTDLVWNKYPLLGRDSEIKLFISMLTGLLEYSAKSKAQRGDRPEYNTLIIKGEPRIGKTRLLDEFTQNIPMGTRCNYVALQAADAEVDSLHISIKLHDQINRLTYSLIHLIFSMPLGFTPTSTRKEREDKLLMRLGKVKRTHFLCVLNQPFNVRFPITPYYNALNEVDKLKILRKFVLKLMKGCFEELWVVLIDDAEYSDQESLDIFDVLTKKDMIFFVLSIGRKLGTDFQLYYSFLSRGKVWNVAELYGIDKWYHAGLACQTLNVNGLPAELEKLIHERSFGNPGWIESYLVSLLQAGGLEIVNITKKEANELGYVLPSLTMLKRFVLNNFTAGASRDYRKDRWQMYRASFKDSMLSLFEKPGDHIVEKNDLSIDNDETMIAVCKISETITYEDVDPEITMDGKDKPFALFDSLTPLDQLLLKCASVIGETVNRHMLESLMTVTSKREIGLVLKMVEPLLKSSESRLLTENQKMELHNQALKYLQHHARRCVPCGEGQFAKLLGKVSTKEDRKRKRKIPSIDEIFDMEYDSASNEDQHFILFILSEVKPFLSCINVFRPVEKRPMLTFSDVDFTSCLCDLILMTVYTQMLEHCRGIGKTEKTLNVILEFADVCLMMYNIPQARKLLAESEVLLGELFHTNEDEMILLPYLSAKIQTLQGHCFLESGSLFEAEQKLVMALHNLGFKFPKMEIVIDLNSILQLIELKSRLICLKVWELDTTQEDMNVNYTEQLAECLIQMFELFRTKGMKKHARLAAIWGLNAALKSNRSLSVICISYTHMLITAHMYIDRHIIPYLEQKSIDICNESKEALEAQELNVIAELYAGIFFSRWIRGLITKATQIGFICCRIANTIGSTFLSLLIIPRLVHLLMIACRHSEVVTQLRELEFISFHDLDKSGRTWYFALCADVHLDTGLTIIPFQTCEQYFLREGEQMISLFDPEAERRYFTSMWLWCIRTEQWEAAKVWGNRKAESTSVMDEQIVAATITSLKRIEGLLILYVHRTNSRNADSAVTMAEINTIFKNVKKVIKIVKIALPRYILMKAYYWMIRSRKNKAMKLLKNLKKLCQKVENTMIYLWAVHCQKVWSGGISSVQTDLWREITASQMLDQGDIQSEINVNDTNMIMFTFPLPNYLY